MAIKINDQLLSPAEIKERLKENLLDDWERKVLLFILDWFSPSDFIFQKTSGSTGKPKDIKLMKNAMISSATKTLNYFSLKPGDSAWLCLPVDYIAGKMMIVRAIVGQLNLYISEPSGTPHIPNCLIDFAAMVPLQIQQMIEAGDDFSAIKKIIVGGAAVDASLEQKLQSLPDEIYATYGMSETCSHIAIQPLNGNYRSAYFKLLPGISVSVNGDDCLVIDAPDLYPKTLVTTDIAEMISPSEFRILGRTDNVINSGGIKISPEQVEELVTPMINSKCIVIGKKDNKLGQKLILVIEGKPEEQTLEDILPVLSSKLGRNKTPKEIVFIEKFPVNKSMKIDRKQIEILINCKE